MPEPRDDTFELYDLRVEVVAPDGAPIYCGAKVGDHFELRGEMPVHAVRLDERHRGRNRAEELLRRHRLLRRGRGSVAAVGGSRVELADAPDDRARLELLGGLLEQRAPFRVDRLGRSQVLLEQLLDEA